jgi:uncharacterized protein involved in response to NO
VIHLPRFFFFNPLCLPPAAFSGFLFLVFGVMYCTRHSRAHKRNTDTFFVVAGAAFAVSEVRFTTDFKRCGFHVALPRRRYSHTNSKKKTTYFP